MKLVDLSKCHEDSPDFRASLSKLEEATNLLEKRLKSISSLCEERKELNQKERAVTLKLIREFELLGSSDPYLPNAEDMETAVNSVEVMTTAMKQLVDNQERMFDQINIGIIRPLQQFLTEDLEQVKSSKKVYYKAHSEAQQITEKFGQCRKHELPVLNEVSLQLFDARTDLHKATCTYTLDLNSLHTKKTPDFLNRVVDFMMSELSFFHLGNVIVKDVEPHITTIFTLVEKLRKESISEGTKQRTQAQNLMEEVLHTRSQRLLHLHTSDLHTAPEVARSTISDHLSKTQPDALVTEKHLELPGKSPPSVRTKAGYMWYAEPRTFGIHWIRLYFYIKNSMLLSEATSKVKVPISLNLNLCNVKPAEASDTERNFSFKVTSPLRVVLLQAEGSLEMQEWIETLSNAITHAIHGAPPGVATHTATPTSGTSGGGANGSSVSSSAGTVANSETMPVKPPRRKSNVSKDLHTVPGNEVCADCGSNKPKWASVNLGVLICIECSGIHRSLGVYVSQVRSLTLDSLKPSVVRRLKAVGNVKSNAVYEANLPEGFDRSQLKKGENRQEFITDKYVSMKYASPANKERILIERQETRAESLRKSGYPVNESNSSNNSGSSPPLTSTTVPEVPYSEVESEQAGSKVQEKVPDAGGVAESDGGGVSEGGGGGVAGSDGEGVAREGKTGAEGVAGGNKSDEGGVADGGGGVAGGNKSDEGGVADGGGGVAGGNQSDEGGVADGGGGVVTAVEPNGDVLEPVATQTSTTA